MFSRTIRIALAAASLVALPAIAYAGGNGKDAPAEHTKGKDGKAQFPMQADAFRAKVETRITKGRERLVAHLTKKNVDADKQKEILAKFDDGAAKVRAATDSACADGTVTKEEAKGVRDLAKSLRHKAHEKGKEARRNHQKKQKDA